MSVNAISAISAFVPYLPDTEYDSIKLRLTAMGLPISGIKSIDKANLERAQKEQAEDKAAEVAQSKSSSASKKAAASETENATFRSILNELGVTPTKDIEYDYRKAVNAIRVKLSTEENDFNINRLNNLKDQMDVIMVNLGYSPISISMSEKIGASTVSDLNKTMMVSTSASKQ